MYNECTTSVLSRCTSFYCEQLIFEINCEHHSGDQFLYGLK